MRWPAAHVRRSAIIMVPSHTQLFTPRTRICVRVVRLCNRKGGRKRFPHQYGREDVEYPRVRVNIISVSENIVMETGEANKYVRRQKPCAQSKSSTLNAYGTYHKPSASNAPVLIVYMISRLIRPSVLRTHASVSITTRI